MMNTMQFLPPFTPLFIEQTFPERRHSARSCAGTVIRPTQPRLVDLQCTLGTRSGRGDPSQESQSSEHTVKPESATHNLTAGKKLNP